VNYVSVSAVDGGQRDGVSSPITLLLAADIDGIDFSKAFLRYGDIVGKNIVCANALEYDYSFNSRLLGTSDWSCSLSSLDVIACSIGGPQIA
jgi:hypothetical protein